MGIRVSGLKGRRARVIAPIKTNKSANFSVETLVALFSLNDGWGFGYYSVNSLLMRPGMHFNQGAGI